MSIGRDVIGKLAEGTLDVLVVGGGIVGSGVARDAAMRGLRTGIIDQYDFAFGTSSRSSRLLHGGLRYLAQGRVGLVHEASVEKVIIHKIAPHLAAPLPFIFPTRRGTEWKRWKLSIGVKIYDLLCHGRNLGKSTSMGKEATLRMLPGLNAENLTGAVRYYDGLTNDARLVLDTLRSAAANGAMCANYVAMISSKREADGLWACVLEDRVTGRQVSVRTKVVVNATGAWADKFPASKVKLRLTKGVHLVIERTRLAVPDAVVMAEGSRILFAIPWGDRVILGTTDTDYDGPTERPGVDQKDVDYILKVTNDTFPSAKLGQGDVISAWSGLRPLIADPNGKPSDISRAHQILMPEAGWIDVAGGKLTTYRLMAEQTVDMAVKHGGMKEKKCETATTPLLPDEDGPKYSSITPPLVTMEAVGHFVKNEWCFHLDDLMIRRTSWRYYHRDHLKIARDVAREMGRLLGWSEKELADEMARYQGALSYPAEEGKVSRQVAMAV
ncbi:MAG TPA: glycerol-3-phosphate dehydrogenase/oxidase [Tepidisphaeraceae bacterium]|jgi:glycerol-3-phosphate dehydrogenase|nr:glycerol-3-phosphate dehydrogenase/oxidase [Tepidisphaeraceae bacterium]